MNLGRLFSLPVLVSLQSLASSWQTHVWVMAVQRSSKPKIHQQTFVRTEVIRLALFAATLLFPGKYPFPPNQGVSHTLLNLGPFVSGSGEQLELRSACGTSGGILLE